MALTLVINPGSSSKKYGLYRDGRLILYATIERTAEDIRYAVRKNDTWIENTPLQADEYERGVVHFIESARKYGSITDTSHIDMVGIRVVAPGTLFQSHQVVDADYMKLLGASTELAPLHIPGVVEEIKSVQAYIPTVSIVAASDSAFHGTKPHAATVYSIDPEFANTHSIYRYGYHGLSVASAVRRIHTIVGQNPARVIVCHIGSGVSVSAIKDGVSMDNSMGYTPGSGLPMASRAGDLDIGAWLQIKRAGNFTLDEVYQYTQAQGGLSGLAGEGDFRYILEQHAKGEQYATEALQLCAYKVKQFIGGYIATLGGVDAVICTGTAAERSPVLRSMFLSGLQELGITLDVDRNDQYIGKDGVVSEIGAMVKVAVMRTDEMGEISRITENFQCK